LKTHAGMQSFYPPCNTDRGSKSISNNVKWRKKKNFYQEGKSTTKTYTCTSELEPASARGPRLFVASVVPLSYTDTLHECESLQNWSAFRCALSDQSYAMLPNVRSYVQEKYSQGRNGAFPDVGSLSRMTPLTLPHMWLPFVGELLDHPVLSVFKDVVSWNKKIKKIDIFWSGL